MNLYPLRGQWINYRIWDIAMLAHESNKQRYIFRGTFRTKFAILRVSHVFVLYLPSRLCTLHFLRGFAASRLTCLTCAPYLRTLFQDLKSLKDEFVIYTAWKMSVLWVILVRIFPHSDWIKYGSPNAGKYKPK